MPLYAIACLSLDHFTHNFIHFTNRTTNPPLYLPKCRLHISTYHFTCQTTISTMPQTSHASDIPTKKTLSYEQRSEILALRRNEKLSYSKIRNEMAKENPTISYDQVRYTCSVGHAMPKRPPTRVSAFSLQRIDEIIEWIRGSFERRQMPFVQIVAVLGLHCSPGQLANALEKAGMGVYPAAVVP